MDAAKLQQSCSNPKKREFIEDQSLHYHQLPHSQCLSTDAPAAAPSSPTLVRHGPARICTSVSNPQAAAPVLPTQMTHEIARMLTSTDKQVLQYPQLGVTNSNVMPTYAGPHPNLVRNQMLGVGMWPNKLCPSSTINTTVSQPGQQTQLPFLHHAYSNRTIPQVAQSLPRTTFSQGLSHTQQQTTYPIPQQSLDGQTKFPLFGKEVQMNKVSVGTDMPTHSMPNNQQSHSFQMCQQNYPSVLNSVMMTDNSMEIDRMSSAIHHSGVANRSMSSRVSLQNHFHRNGSLPDQYTYNHAVSQPVSCSNGNNAQMDQPNFICDSSNQIKNSCSNLQDISRLNEKNMQTSYTNRVATCRDGGVNVFSNAGFQMVVNKFACDQVVGMAIKRASLVQVSAAAGSTTSNMGTMTGSNRRQSVDDSRSIHAAFVIPQNSTTIFNNSFSRDSLAEDKQLLNKWYVPPSENLILLPEYQNISPPLCQPISPPSDHHMSEHQETTLCSQVTDVDSTMKKIFHNNTFKPTTCTEDIIEYKVADMLHHLPSQYLKSEERKSSNSNDSSMTEPSSTPINSVPSTEADSLKLNPNLKFDSQSAAEAVYNIDQDFNFICRSPLCFEHHVDTAAILDENKRKIETELVLNSQFDSQDISSTIDLGEYLPSLVMSKSLSPVNVHQTSERSNGKIDTFQTVLPAPTCAVQDIMFKLHDGNTSLQDVHDISTEDKKSAGKKHKSSCEASLADGDIHLKNSTPLVSKIKSKPGGSHSDARRGQETVKIRITRAKKSHKKGKHCRDGHAKGDFIQKPFAISLLIGMTKEKPEAVYVVLDSFSEEEQQNTSIDLTSLKDIFSLREHCKSGQDSKDDGLPLDCDIDMENIPPSVATSSSNSDMGDLIRNPSNKLPCSVNDVVSGNSSNDTIETKDELYSNANVQVEIDVEVSDKADAVYGNICDISDLRIKNKDKSYAGNIDESALDMWKDGVTESEPSAQLCDEISTRNNCCNENSANADSETIYSASETHKLTWVRFHGKVVTSLITPDGHFFILKEILKRCFRIQKPSKENFDKIQVVRRSVLKIPDVELDSVLYHAVCKTLLHRKIIKTAPKTFGVISEFNANRLFHYVCKTEFCNHGCVTPYSKSETPASTKLDFDSRNISVNSTHTAIVTKSQHVNSNIIPSIEQGSEMVLVTNMEQGSEMVPVTSMEQGSEMVPVTNMEQGSEMVPVKNTLKRNKELDISKKTKILDTLKETKTMETQAKTRKLDTLKKVKRLDVKQDKNIVKRVKKSQKFDNNFANIDAQKSEERKLDSVAIINLCSDEENGFETDGSLPYIDGVACERSLEIDEEYDSVNNSGSNSLGDILTVSCNDKSVLTYSAGKDIDVRDTSSDSVIDLTDTALDSLQLSEGKTCVNVHDNHMNEHVIILNVSDCKSATAIIDSVCCVEDKLDDTLPVTNDYGLYEDKSCSKEKTNRVITIADGKQIDRAALGTVEHGSATVQVCANDNYNNINAVIADIEEDGAILKNRDCALVHEITCEMKQSVCSKLVQDLNVENYYNDNDDIEMLQFQLPPDDFDEDALEKNKQYLYSLTQQCNSVTREDSSLPRLIDEMLSMGEPLVNWTRVVYEKIKENVKRFSVEDKYEDSQT